YGSARIQGWVAKDIRPLSRKRQERRTRTTGVFGMSIRRRANVRPWIRSALLPALISASLALPMTAAADARDQAKRIYDRIAGVPPSAATLDAMQTKIETNNDPVGAALMATQDPAFYNVTLKNFAAPWTNRDGNVFVPLNDYTATV